MEVLYTFKFQYSTSGKLMFSVFVHPPCQYRILWCFFKYRVL